MGLRRRTPDGPGPPAPLGLHVVHVDVLAWPDLLRGQPDGLRTCAPAPRRRSAPGPACARGDGLAHLQRHRRPIPVVGHRLARLQVTQGGAHVVLGVQDVHHPARSASIAAGTARSSPLPRSSPPRFRRFGPDHAKRHERHDGSDPAGADRTPRRTDEGLQKAALDGQTQAGGYSLAGAGRDAQRRGWGQPGQPELGGRIPREREWGTHNQGCIHLLRGGDRAALSARTRQLTS